MGSQPGAQQGPEALCRVHMHFMEAIPLVITGVFAPAVADRVVVKAPCRQPVVDVVFVSVHASSRRNALIDERPDGGLLDVFEQPNEDRSTALNHADDGRLFALQGAASPRSFQTPPSATPTLFFTAAGCPL